MINRLYSEHKNNDTIFLGINLDSNTNKLKKIITKYDLKFMHTYNPYLTFPSKLLGTISIESASVIIVNKKGEISLLWTLINDTDYKEITKSIIENLNETKK